MEKIRGTQGASIGVKICFWQLIFTVLQRTRSACWNLLSAPLFASTTEGLLHLVLDGKRILYLLKIDLNYQSRGNNYRN